VAAATELGPRLWIKQVEDAANPLLRPLLNLLAMNSLPVTDGGSVADYVAEVVSNLQALHFDRLIAAAKGRLSRAEANGSGYADATIEIQRLEAEKRALLAA
jgi:hypothetical protein